MIDLYRNIKKFRLEQNMTQDDLAKLTGYTDRSSIAKIERGDVDLPQSKILLFASALKIDAGTLMGNSGIAPSVLSQEESDLLYSYSLLNQEGREKVVDYISDLIDSGKYKKYNSSELVEKEA